MFAHYEASGALEDVWGDPSEGCDTQGDELDYTNDDEGDLCCHVLFVGGVQKYSQKLSETKRFKLVNVSFISHTNVI